jgi:hypothetical protein
VKFFKHIHSLQTFFVEHLVVGVPVLSEQEFVQDQSTPSVPGPLDSVPQDSPKGTQGEPTAFSVAVSGAIHVPELHEKESYFVVPKTQVFDGRGVQALPATLPFLTDVYLYCEPQLSTMV